MSLFNRHFLSVLFLCLFIVSEFQEVSAFYYVSPITTYTYITDDFEDGEFDPMLMDFFTPHPDEPVEENGGFVFRIDATDGWYHPNYSAPWVKAVSRKRLKFGDLYDFDVSVNFRDLQLRENDSMTMAILSTTDEVVYPITVANRFGILMVDTGSTPLALAATSGTLRIVQNHNTELISGYILIGEEWISLGEISESYKSKRWRVSLSLIESQPGFSSVTFDNYHAAGMGSVTPALSETGLFERFSFDVSENPRDCRMYVPQSTEPGKALGIVFGYHGFVSDYKYQPHLGFLDGNGFEGKAEKEGFITVSLSTYQDSPEGWQGGWYGQSGSENLDAWSTENMIEILKANYNIDEDRIFAVGSSSGGSFCSIISTCIPGVFAALAPVNPVSSYNPPEGDHIACMIVGGVTDPLRTTEEVRDINTFYRQAGLDADCWVVDMGHQYPPKIDGDSWTKRICEYFRAHPRGYMEIGSQPEVREKGFTYHFDNEGYYSGPGFKVTSFDTDGVLYGRTGTNGTPPSSVFGYTLRKENGYAINEPLGTGEQGVMAKRGYFQAPFVWKTSFVVDTEGTSLTLTPCLIADTRGRIFSLRLQKNQWQFRRANTHLAFRSNDPSQISILNSGDFALTSGDTYDLKLFCDESLLEWELSNTSRGLEYKGDLDLNGMLEGPYEIGLALSGEGVLARFEFAELKHLSTEVQQWVHYE